MAENYPGLTVPPPLARTGLVDRRRPRREPVRDRDGDRGDAALAPRPGHRAASPRAPGTREAVQSQRPAPAPRGARRMARRTPARSRRRAYLEQRYGTEPYRIALSLLAADLGAASAEDMRARLLETTPHQARVRGRARCSMLDIIAAAVPPHSPGSAPDRAYPGRPVRPPRRTRWIIREDAGRLAAAFERHPPGARHRVANPRDAPDAKRTACSSACSKAPPAPATPPRPGSTTAAPRPGPCSGCSAHPSRIRAGARSGRS